MRHFRKCAFTNVAYVDTNMDSIFEFNNLRLSPELYVLPHFCNKDDCCVVAYGCFFLPEHLQCEWRGKAKVLHCLHC